MLQRGVTRMQVIMNDVIYIYIYIYSKSQNQEDAKIIVEDKLQNADI